jgi:hypothetical protein
MTTEKTPSGTRLTWKTWGIGALVALLALLDLASLLLPALGSGAASQPATRTVLPHTAPRNHQPVPHAQQYSTSADWSGYATTGGAYTSVSGTWTQPSVTCSDRQTTYAAFWVGLDGDTSTTVEQLGTESDCSRGTPTYSTWYELYPANPVTIEQPVTAGDTLSASVTATGSGGFTLTLSDTTQGWTFTTTGTVTDAQLSSAECIAEAPSDGRRTLPLADFGTVTFAQCTANSAPISASPNVDAIALTTPRGVVEAEPSVLSAGDASFSVTVQSSGT